MGATLLYFRKHPWQRRACTVMAALLIGLSAGYVAAPIVRDRLILRDLGSGDSAVRAKAISRAVAAARQSSTSLDRLEAALHSVDDHRFAGVVTALRHLGKFNPAQRGGELLDRMTAIELATTDSEEVRTLLLGPLILSDRNNAYVRKAAATARADRSPKVRALAALLTAILKDDQALAALMKDPEPAVVAAAALDAGLAGRSALLPQVRSLLETAQESEVISTAALACAKLDAGNRNVQGQDAPATHGRDARATSSAASVAAAIAQRLANARDENLRDRLIYVLSMLDDPAARSAVQEQFARAGQAGEFPSASLLLAAGRLKLTEAGPVVRSVLNAAADGSDKLSVAQASAGLEAAEALDMPIRREALRMGQILWRDDADYAALLRRCAAVLGRQAGVDQGGQADVPSRDDCIKALEQMAHFASEPATQPTSEATSAAANPQSRATSAAAAVALWELRSPQAGELVRSAADDLSGSSYVAWHLAALPDRADAFELGLAMLPPPNSPPALRVFNDNQRQAGAMLLAWSARGAEQKAQAVARIEPRLVGGQSAAAKGTYACSLLILGRAEHRPRVWALLEGGGFPENIALTALLASGDKAAADWLLWNRQLGSASILNLLLRDGVGEVLAAAAPALPHVDAAVEGDLALWQVAILRSSYALGRSGLSLGIKR